MSYVGWFCVVIGYCIQTKGFSYLQSNNFLPLEYKLHGDKIDITKYSLDDLQNGMTVYLTSIFFASMLLLLPIALSRSQWNKLNFIECYNYSNITSNFVNGDTINNSNNNNNNNNISDNINGNGNNSNSNNTINGTQESFEMHDLVTENRSMSMEISLDMLNLVDNYNDNIESRDENKKWFNLLIYLAKLIILSITLLFPIFIYIFALSMSPAFDIALIQNVSIFEIVTLLYGVCGVSKKRFIIKNYLIMMVALISILIISYTKATCDILAGKLSINPNTGEVIDPYLFDRLKASLVCGLGNLPIGLFAVLWNLWFNKRSNNIQQQCAHLSIIGIIGLIILFPFIPNLKISYKVISLFNGDGKFWFTLVASIFFGSIPYMFSMVWLNMKYPPEYLTTCNLGIIIFMGIADWLLEPTQTTIVRWEVISYILLSICCILLESTLR